MQNGKIDAMIFLGISFQSLKSVKLTGPVNLMLITIYRWSLSDSNSSATLHSFTLRAADGEAHDRSTMDPPASGRRC